ncbi:MAG: GspH/FimT family pseudopilin [candidate division NC10 bacterium]|nr:GspH/FimT family pseudopilin [candidate division NC10 bacterium]
MEVLIALVVVLLLAGIATPSLLRTRDAYRIRTAAWELVGTLRLARQRAVTEHRRTRLVVNAAGAALEPNTYVLQQEEGAVLSGVWIDLGPRYRLPGGVSLGPAGAVSVTFSAKGGADPGTLILANVTGEYRVVVNVVGRVTVCQGAC